MVKIGSKYINIDRQDLPLINKYKWRIDKKGYLVRKSWLNGKPFTFYFHRVIMYAKSGQFIDHINNDKLDNRRSNLRLCTRRQNSYNSIRYKKGFKGTLYHKRDKLWGSFIYLPSGRKYLGYFKSEEEAHIMYCFAAQFHFGDYANGGYKHETKT